MRAAHIAYTESGPRAHARQSAVSCLIQSVVEFKARKHELWGIFRRNKVRQASYFVTLGCLMRCGVMCHEGCDVIRAVTMRNVPEKIFKVGRTECRHKLSQLRHCQLSCLALLSPAQAWMDWISPFWKIISSSWTWKKIQNFPIILEKWGSLRLYWRIESSVENDKMTVDDFLMSQIWTVTQI